MHEMKSIHGEMHLNVTFKASFRLDSWMARRLIRKFSVLTTVTQA